MQNPNRPCSIGHDLQPAVAPAGTAPDERFALDRHAGWAGRDDPFIDHQNSRAVGCRRQGRGEP